MISLESYELEYNVFLAEQEMFKDIFQYGAMLLNESTGLVYINEGFKETISKYIEKITAAIQKAWDRFKEIVTKQADQVYLKTIASKIATVEDPGFTIIGYKSYDLNKLNNIKLIPFNYEEMKQYLDTQETFINQYYSTLVSSDGKSLKEKITNYIVASTKDERCTKELLQSMFKFVSTEFKNHITKVEQDLKVVNSSNKSIQNLMNMITPPEVKKESVVLYEIYIHEDDIKFQDDPNKVKEDNGSLVKHISNYMKASTDVLSVKMDILRTIYAQNMKTIKHFIKPEKTEKTKSQEQTTGSTNPEVKI